MAVSARPAMAPSARRTMKIAKKIGDAAQPILRIIRMTCLLTPQEEQRYCCNMLRSPCPVYICLCCAGIPMEEDEYEQDTSIKGRLLMLVNKIKGQAHKAEEPTEKEQAAPCEEVTGFITL